MIKIAKILTGEYWGNGQLQVRDIPRWEKVVPDYELARAPWTADRRLGTARCRYNGSGLRRRARRAR
jgi:hypothetical protein